MIDETAKIGMSPQHRDWKPGDQMWEPVIADSATIRAFCTIDSGMVRPTRVGKGTLIMSSCHVGHDVIIGDQVEIAPMTSIGGHVRIGNGVKIGQGATFKPFVTVGEGARIGMGAVVLSNVPAYEIWAGNPARRLKPVDSEQDSVQERWKTYTAV